MSCSRSDEENDNNVDALLSVVNLQRDEQALNLTQVPEFNSRDTFLTDVNTVCKLVKECYRKFSSLVVFKDTSNLVQPGHPRDKDDKSAKPDFVAGFEEHWHDGRKDDGSESGDSDDSEDEVHPKDPHSHILWPLIRVAGETAPERPKYRDIETIEYSGTCLCLLLDARPDFRVALGLVLDKTEVYLLVGEAGAGIHHFTFAWGSRSGSIPTSNLSTSQLQPTTILPLVGTVSDSPQLICRMRRRPRIRCNGSSLNVIKMRLCRKDVLGEIEILERIHEKGSLPGVIRLLFYERLPYPYARRNETWMGFNEIGQSFMSIKTVREMLMVEYDVLEITRMLFLERNVLHRDISKGNVLYIPPSEKTEASDTHNSKKASDDTKQSMGSRYCFSKYLLGERRDDGGATCALWSVLRFKGTAAFMARAIYLGGPLTLDFYFSLPSIPLSAHLASYEKTFPDRVSMFSGLVGRDIGLDPSQRWKLNREPPYPIHGPWRHRLYHDAESVYWLMVFWALFAKPSVEVEGTPEHEGYIPQYCWIEFCSGRKHNWPDGCKEEDIHPAYRPFYALLREMQRYLYVDPHWFPRDSPISRPEFLHECFQRVILSFLMSHSEEEFMTLEKSDEDRAIPVIRVPRPS
ncbi:other/FunK1 protein kinase [Coprinopsis cinerea okayama7|uniref:Other/FunK1 protein kinase n=1 Tax=Coprinopsis cinerea (strain Okayama-7 / 130 / ATCC MYA-4618 / FGSC 9003) TaxID=240176 RepID=D6RQ51_COPC7|nr:other/FunK1 protein kinase [Coprinopsis cinerea okayama7\|eukprot:XP_002910367.1 other/FunK1 protein kinase [Coprinopsis cinerea okayama7\